MKTFYIEIGGSSYPARLVMGALLMYKRETGKDVNSLETDDLEGMMRLIWCCVKCASQAEGIDFGYDFETFCNLITPGDLEQWNSAMTEEKKKA